MATGSDVALARISGIAYAPIGGLPAGFTPVTSDALAFGPGLSAQESYANGVYTNRNGEALVLVGTLSGVTTLVLAFRGSSNREDSINDLQHINDEYQLYANLVTAVDQFAARQGITQVAVTGHSLGGAMTQIYMATHPDTAATHYIADTFGSPGAQIPAGNDSRITNFRIADDPAVYLGEHRAQVGLQLQTNPALAAAAVFTGPEVFPGLTQTDVIQAIPDLNSNYVNRGTDVLLPDADGSYKTVDNLIDAVNAGKSEHLVGNYIARLEAVTGSTGDDQAGATITPTVVGTQLYRFFDKGNGTHFYTASQTEERQLVATRPDLTFEGVGLNGVAATDPAAAPVYRFFEAKDGSHFYTTSATEKATIGATRPDLVYEGIAFYEHLTPAAGDAAVTRFFDKTDGTHFYTANAAEKAAVIATRPDLVNEGVAFYTLSA